MYHSASPRKELQVKACSFRLKDAGLKSCLILIERGGGCKRRVIGEARQYHDSLASTVAAANSINHLIVWRLQQIK